MVADEVRKLAEKTMQATKEVETAIKYIQSGTSDAVQEMDETRHRVDSAAEKAEGTGSSLMGVIEETNRMVDMIRGIATAAEQQSSTSEEINSSLSELNNLAQDIQRQIQDAGDSIHQVADMSQDLSTLVGDFNKQE